LRTVHVTFTDVKAASARSDVNRAQIKMER
jgi:hypothetical protein